MEQSEQSGQGDTRLRARIRLPVMGATAAPELREDDSDIAAELAAWEQAERERLGIRAARRQWADTMVAPSVRKNERDHVTLLLGGLTVAQDFLVEGALAGLGYKSKHLDVPDSAGLQVGKEFGNRGQCNPTYFTVGNLVKYLVDLRDRDGISAEDIIRSYVFVTAGACGPCRFGMYVTEYRKALRDAGFDGFRVMLFQQQGGLDQATGNDVGLEFNPAFFVAIVKAIVCGDVLNAMGYRIRPYEVVPGTTNGAMEEAKKILYGALRERTNIFWALWKCKKLFANIEVDKLRPRAKASIIGEFWAMTTEGDGNYHLQKFLESEGAENDIQLTTAWILYNIWEVSRDTRERQDLRGVDEANAGLAQLDEIGVAKRLASLRLAEWALRIGFQLFAQPIGLYDYHLPDMDLVARVAQEHYSNDLRGGEGHMEVGKLIVNAVESKAHITVSVKPFGCMPSSGVSDGVQSLVTTRYPGCIFCAVETSGDGATNFYSRIQMYMFKARIVAEAELDRVLRETGVTREQVRAHLAGNRRLASPLHHAPHRVAGSAANLVYEVAPRLTRSRAHLLWDSARGACEKAAAAARFVPAVARKAREVVTRPETRERLGYDLSLLRDVLRGKAEERFRPLAQKLVGRAYFGDDRSGPSAEDLPLAAQ